MVSLTPNQLISQQAYSNHYNRKRLIGIEEDSAAITHLINFELNDHLELVARVKYCWENPKIPSIITLNEDKIYYLSDKAFIIHGSGVPRAAAPLSETLQKWEIIFMVSQRTVVVRDIEIDEKYYAKLNNSSKSFDSSMKNKSYVLIAPAPVPQARPISLKPRGRSPDSLSSEDSQQSTKEEALDEASKTPPPSPLRLRLSQTPEAELDT
jgi:hypothetical protein